MFENRELFVSILLGVAAVALIWKWPTRKFVRIGENRAKQIDFLKTCLEIIAIFVAAYWAYDKLVHVERGEKISNFATTEDLRWSPNPDTLLCNLAFSAKFTNTSKGTIDIRRAKRRLWSFALPAVPTAEARFIDLESMMTTSDTLTHTVRSVLSDTLLDSLTVTKGAFVRKYPPGASDQYDFSWQVRRRQGFMIARIDLFTSDHGSDAVAWTYVWGDICHYLGDSIKPKLKLTSAKAP
jgi:hypothetical protein